MYTQEQLLQAKQVLESIGANIPVKLSRAIDLAQDAYKPIVPKDKITALANLIYDVTDGVSDVEVPTEVKYAYHVCHIFVTMLLSEILEGVTLDIDNLDYEVDCSILRIEEMPQEVREFCDNFYLSDVAKEAIYDFPINRDALMEHPAVAVLCEKYKIIGNMASAIKAEYPEADLQRELELKGVII